MAGTMVTRTYGNFRGVDFANRTPDLTRSPDAVNLWKNYMNEGKSVETRPLLAVKDTYQTNININGVYKYHGKCRDYLITHHGGIITAEIINPQTGDTVVINTDSGITPANRKSTGFQIDEKFYILDGSTYLILEDKESTTPGSFIITMHRVDSDLYGIPYVPTTSINRTPEGKGTQYQAVNLLSDYRKNTFVADGESTEYYLDVEVADSVINVYVNGTATSAYTFTNEGKAHVTFTTAPSAPATEGQANVEIEYKYSRPGVVHAYQNRINHCRLCLPFDDRVFFTGNPDYPNAIFYTALDNPTYVPDINWTKAGTDSSPIKALVNGNNSLWAFKESNPNETTIFYYVPATNPDTGATYYYAQNSTILKGCESTAKNFNDDIVCFTKDGMEGVTGDLQSEQVLGMRSSMVNSKLLNESQYKNLSCSVWRNYLMVGMGKHIYLADSTQRFQNEAGKLEYEWFYWDMSTELTDNTERITVMTNIDDTLYVGTNKKLYTLTDTTSNVTAYWTTPSDDLGYPSYRKVSNKRGCTMRMKGTEVQIKAKMDAGEFSNIATYTNTKGYIVPRIKLKKWKEVQFKFTSDKRFGVYDMTMEFYVGGYVKR